MDSETTVAVVALLATILGAVIGAAASYIVALRQERAARESDKRRNAIEAKRAARLVDAELANGAAAVSMALEQKEWWPDLIKVSSEVWEKYAGTLAPELTDEDWLQLVEGYNALNFFSNTRSTSIKVHGNEKILMPPPVLESYGLLLEHIKAARHALDKFAFPDSVATETKAPTA